MAQQVHALPTLAPVSIKLDRKNHHYWRAQVLAAVTAHMLEGILLGTALVPPQFVTGSDDNRMPNPDYSLWLRRDQLLVSWLLASISESLLGYVTRCSHAADIWSVLETSFRTVSKARQMNLRLQLQTTKKGDSPVEDYILRMKAIADNLHAAGHEVSDEELITYILNGFGTDYESVVVNLSARTEDLTLQDVQYALQTHEMRIQQQIASQNTHMAAHVVTQGARRGRQSSGGRSSFPGGRGSSCGGSGRGYGRGSFFNQRPPVVCQICGKNNHIASKCFKRFDKEFAGIDLQAAQAHIMYTNAGQCGTVNQPSPSVARPSTSVNTQASTSALSAVNSQSSLGIDPTWYVDSGATNHVTSDVQNLGHQAVYNGRDELVVGNGSHLPISHTGLGHSSNPFEGIA